MEPHMFINEIYAVGKEGHVESGGFQISVIVRDVRVRHFFVDFLVEPTAGTGLVWVDSAKVRIDVSLQNRSSG
jgi:hypothetical protein